ncbi:MAG: hypothetical protein EPN26_13765 [Rhodospirillales bacterium]|nr:MAG: hypothetical protein EPN26_13765 [Rhodospirillales bacterium]
MESTTTAEFWQLYRSLPESVRQIARDNYRLWRNDPRHPSLHFKRLRTSSPLYSVRVGLHCRALGLVENIVITWFWIGSHAEYDRLVS